MAKQSYKIPADLNHSYGDMEIALSTKDGISAKPMPIKVIMTYLGSILVCMYLVMNTPIGSGSILQTVLFVILWIALTLLLASYDTTRRMQVQLIPTLTNYMSYVARHVSTRTMNSANAFYSVAGIENIDDNGLVEYADGTYAYWYRVVGSASVLLFDGDKMAILDRVDNFYRKIGTDVEVGYMTTKEAQKVYRQIAHLSRLYNNLNTADPDLQACADEQFKILKNYVGKSFKSIHQYMFLKADNMEALTVAKNVLQSEIENSRLMIKQCVPLYPADLYEVLRMVYRQ